MTDAARQKKISSAISIVVARLNQVYSLWHQAHNSYFDPTQFRIALQNCITTSRSVTFIIQNQKHVIPDFEIWYAPHRQAFEKSEVMRWAKNARNKIEKQGDLETLSQVRAELIAAYVGNPISNWIPAHSFSSPEEIRHTIPKKFLDAHVIENGILSIERRWVDSELPNYELLDALAHVYGQLAIVIVTLYEHCGMPLPPAKSSIGEALLTGLLSDGRPPSMERPLEDRAIYISVKDGSILGYRKEFKPFDLDISKKALKRYGNNKKNWERLKDANSLYAVADIFFSSARLVMLKDGYHIPLTALLRGFLPVQMISATPMNRGDKYMLMRDTARLARRIRADGVIHISEAWIAKSDEVRPGEFAVDSPNPGEALILSAACKSGEFLNMRAIIRRKKLKRNKVKRLEKTEIDTEMKPMALAPFFEVWNKLDILLREENKKINSASET